MLAKQAENKVELKAELGEKKIGIVVSRFNEFVTTNLLQGCLAEFTKFNVTANNLIVQWVPGAFEVPVAAAKLARENHVVAVICLGAVIRGETFHFELIAREAASGIMRVALDTQKPVIFGILTTDTIDQAYHRSQETGNNKGRDAARAALEMIELLKSR